MKRYIRLCLLTVILSAFALTDGYSVTEQLSDTVQSEQVRVLLKDVDYVVNKEYVIRGTVIVEPGTTIYFNDNSRIVVAEGGRLIADGYAHLKAKIQPTAPEVGPYPLQFADMKYFLYPIASGNNATTAKTAGLTTAEMAVRERTVHPLKYNHIFNVAIDTLNRKLVNIANPYSSSWPTANISYNGLGALTGYTYGVNQSNPNLIVVPYETAMMFMAARMNMDPVTNSELKLLPWKRISGNGESVDITPAQITFRAVPQQGNSPEYGHIVVLPGARAAFFRNCQFMDCRKDITVDDGSYYGFADIKHNLNQVELNELNNRMLELANGGGGAITTFSSRTWLLNCVFDNNSARNRGGALQILQTPTSYFYPNNNTKTNDTLNIPRFDFSMSGNKNFKVSDADKHTSTVLTRNSHNYNRYPVIDRIDESKAEYFGSDRDRIAWDDARLAGYLGRFRNLEFTNNVVMLAELKVMNNKAQYDTNSVLTYPQKWGNMAYGGAIYVAGTEDDARQIEFALGLNDSIRLGDDKVLQNPNGAGYRDYIKFYNNSARNFQKNKYTDGAKGGAIYVGKNTSLIVAGEFEGNYTHTKWLVDVTTTGEYNEKTPTPYLNGILYSAGGAVYADNQPAGRLQVRGGNERNDFRVRNATYGSRSIENNTKFTNNRAGAGGAIYVAESPDVLMSPQIGGSDVNATLNNFGNRISFTNNYAYSAGGAIFSKRNMEVVGAGGERDNFNYFMTQMVRFDSNAAAFAGGAVHIEIPTGPEVNPIPNTRIANFRRADFVANNVGKLAYGNSANVNNLIKNEIRGGGAIYALWTDLNVVKAVNFEENEVYNGNGAAVQLANPFSKTERLFLSDLDVVHYTPLPVNAKEGTPKVACDYTSINNPFTFGKNYPNEAWVSGNGDAINLPNDIAAKTGMLTRFHANKAYVEEEIGAFQINNYGNTQMGDGYIMPNSTLLAQHWFNANSGIVAGLSGTLVRISKNPSDKWEWKNMYVVLNGGLDTIKHHNYTDIHFVSQSNGFLTSNYGMIFRTTDNGATWTKVFDADDIVESINDISFAGISGQGAAVTSKGRILTTNDGINWVVSSNVYTQALNGIHWATNNIGYIVGEDGLVLKTIDAGATWVQQFVPGLYTDLTKVFFLNASKGFAIGTEGVMIATTDGGATWNFVYDVFPLTDRLTSIAFVSDYGLVTTNSGKVFATTDGGATWTLNEEFGKNIYSAFIFDRNTRFLVGSEDFVRRTLDASVNWEAILPYNKSEQKGNPRLHGGIEGLVENGVGLGGAMYILDFQNKNMLMRTDSIHFNRVRMTDNFAFTGSAIYSDNYDLKLVFNRSLIRGNKTDTNNTVGREQNAINGPYNKDRDAGYDMINLASSDLAAATIYGEIQGPFPVTHFSTNANSIFENEARFLIRLPDAPNTKGVMAGEIGKGSGGTDTLIGNYWGKTEANVTLTVLNLHENPSGTPVGNSWFETFFVATNVATDNYLPYFNKIDINDPNEDLRKQGPFEYNTSDYIAASRNLYTYKRIELNNDPSDENIPGNGTIPEKYLFSHGIYDLYDKGTDVKTADYSKRRMVPVEDFAVGSPAAMKIEYVDEHDSRPDLSLKTKYVKRWVRNPEYANAVKADGTPKYPELNKMQKLWDPLKTEDGDETGIPKYYHPLGMPIYLESEIDYTGDINESNWDYNHQAATVFFVINETTGDYIRVEFKQVPREYDVPDSIWADPVLRANVFIVPDSTNRGDTKIRRNYEGLRNLPSISSELLKYLCPRDIVAGTELRGILNAAENEDFAALTGRKYSEISVANKTDFRLGYNDKVSGKLYSNRPDMPDDNDVDVASGTESKNTYFAGERYGTLPAKVGDEIRIISRNVLWKEGVNAAYNGGIAFTVKEGAEAPIFTGDVVMFDVDALNPYVTNSDGEYPVYNKIRPDKDNSIGDTTVVKKELLNKLFVKTNRDYPATDGTYSDLRDPLLRGTDRIISITAVDRNGFYDPRVELFSNTYTSLKYGWEIPDPDAGLNYWVVADTIRNQTKDGAMGYIELAGTPINPYIVPGGEKIRVSAENYAPGIVMIDSLRASGVTEDDINMYYQTFPPYLNAPVYNTDNARYLQQDTIAMRNNIAISKEISIYVMDSLPRFIAYNAPVAQFRIKKDVQPGEPENEFEMVDYTPTHYQAGVTNVNNNGKERVIATLTDQLRFKIDINTDDELEDATAEAKDWDFRYGRSAYSFGNLGITAGGEDVLVDTLIINNDVNLVSQLKPSWMNNYEYFRKYDDIGQQDIGLAEFQKMGTMNIRIPRADALVLLLSSNPNLPTDRVVYNTDTVMAIVANDGHSGKSTQFYDLYINFQPEFVTTALVDAEEGVEYNLELSDMTKAILIYDANADQKHTFELVYRDDTRTDLAIDPFFVGEVPPINLAPYKTTPDWLKINSHTGMLYGVPEVVDIADTEVQVSVIVTDEYGLSNIKQFDLTVKLNNQPPRIVNLPVIECLVSGQQIEEEFVVSDRDLLRTGADPEELTLTVNADGSNFEIVPSTITGPTTKEEVVVKIRSNGPFTYLPGSLVNGMLPIVITVKDKSEAEETVTIYAHISDPVTFLSTINVRNVIGANQDLTWGTAPNATTGDSDGKLDSNYCEIEIPPVPNEDIFDARWDVNITNGIYRNIFPTARPTDTNNAYAYKAEFQAGGVNSGSSSHYPVTLRWNPDEIPARSNTSLNPAGSSWILQDEGTNGSYFSINMNEVANRSISSGIARFITLANGEVELEIIDNKIEAFHIYYDIHSTDIEDIVGLNPTELLAAYPNPITQDVDDVRLSFDIQKSGNVYIEIFDVLGNKVATVVDAYYNAGTNYDVFFNLRDFKGSKLSTGSYTVRLTAGTEISMLQLIVLN